MAILESLESKIGRACLALVKADPDFAAYYRNRGTQVDVYRVGPAVDSDWIHIPMMTIQSVPERDEINRTVGKLANPTVHIRFRLWEPPTAAPIVETTPPPVTINDLIVHLEALLEKGTDGDGLAYLRDVDTGDYLNSAKPQISRETPQLVDTTPDADQPTLAMVFPVIATYITTQRATTRQRVNP